MQALFRRESLAFLPSPARNLAVTDPLWLGDGRLVVTVWSKQFPHLAYLNTKSGALSRIETYRDDGCTPTGASFPTLAGPRVAYLTTCFGRVARPLQQLSSIAVLTPSTGANSRISSLLPLFGVGRFTFSPTGTHAFVSSGGLRSTLSTLDRGLLRKFPMPLDRSGTPAWSPDGSSVFIDGIPRGHGDNDLFSARPSLYVFSPDRPVSLKVIAQALPNLRPMGASWMPNSHWIVIVMQPPGQRNGLWLLDVNTHRKELLIQGGDLGRAAVSPDGRYLAVGVGIDANLDRQKPDAQIGTFIVRLPSTKTLQSRLA
jgi:hypothetical protein